MIPDGGPAEVAEAVLSDRPGVVLDVADGRDEDARAELNRIGGSCGGGRHWEVRGRRALVWDPVRAEVQVRDVFAAARERMTAEDVARLRAAVRALGAADVELEHARRPGRHMRDPGREAEIAVALPRFQDAHGEAMAAVRACLAAPVVLEDSGIGQAALF